MIALRGVDDSSGAARTVGVLYFWDFMEFSLVSPWQDFRFAFFRTLHTSSRSGTLATSPRPQARSSAPERKKALPRHGVITLCAWPSHYGCAKAQKKRLITLAVERSKDLARLSFLSLSGWTSRICVGGCESPLEDRRGATGLRWDYRVEESWMISILVLCPTWSGEESVLIRLPLEYWSTYSG